MHGRELQTCAAARSRELPPSTLEFPFGADFNESKVRGTMSMFHAAVDGEPQVILTALPFDSMSLRAAHADVTPGYHMNKQHWISRHPGGTPTADMVDELVTESYRLVVAGLPKDPQPVEPETFGRGQRA